MHFSAMLFTPVQCRQKTVEGKAKCGSCTLHWCPRCLLNRYGEEVAAVHEKPGWACPRCRGDCNCSNCRKVLAACGVVCLLGHHNVCPGRCRLTTKTNPKP